jgi:hypothetical protein
MPWTANAREHCWRDGLGKQVFSVVTRRRVQELADAHQADKWCKKFFSAEHLRVAVALVLLPIRSLRGLAVALKPGGLLNPHGSEPVVRRSSLTDAFAKRSWAFFADVYAEVVEAIRQRVAAPAKRRRRTADSVKLIDATTLPLIHRLIGVFTGTQSKASAKVNLRIDEPTRLPESLVVSEGRRHERRTVEALIDWSLQGVTYIFDRGYFCTHLFDRLIDAGHYFITLLKDNVTAWTVCELKRYRPGWQEGFQLLADSIVELDGPNGRLLLRLVEARDEAGHHWKVLTNHFDLSAMEVCTLYRKRWAIENFFRTLKRQLDLREYAAANANAIMIIILCTLIAYCLAQAAVLSSPERVTLAEAIQMLQTLSAWVWIALEQALSRDVSSTSTPAECTSSSRIIVELLLTA